MRPLLTMLGYNDLSDDTLKTVMSQIDQSHDGKASLEEFCEFLQTFMMDDSQMDRAPKTELKLKAEDDEEEEMPEDLVDLDPATQIKRVIMRSIVGMGSGTALVLVFSDPMVDCLSEWGNRLGVSPFYISFLLAPFASNASELLSAYTYAVKKTEKGITTGLSTLIGAACMNNTFCLAIFFALIWKQELAWQFTAETIAIVVIQFFIGIVAMASKTQSMLKGFVILGCYPGCLALVWFLENIVGLD